MSQKQVKKYARTIKRNKNKIIKDFVKTVKDYNLGDRLIFAWSIIRAK